MQIRGDTQALAQFLDDGITLGDALDLLPLLPQGSIDLFFTSPPYADARAYSRIHPDHYVEWFLPFAQEMFNAASESGSLILNMRGSKSTSNSLMKLAAGLPKILPLIFRDIYSRLDKSSF